MNSVTKSKIRICFILSHLPQGGAERQTINLIRGLDPEEYDISLLLYGGDTIFYKEILDLPVKLVVNRASAAGRVSRNLKNSIFLRRVLLNENYDILHTLLNHNGFWVRVLAPRKYNNRIIYSIRNDISDSPGLFLHFEKLLIRKSQVVSNSQKVLNQFRELVGERYSHKIRLIYNGFDTGRFASNEPPGLSQRIILGTVGRQTSQKNQIQILEAVNELPEGDEIHLFLIGDKSQDMAIVNEEYVKINNMESTVSILDSLPDIESYYKQFNIFILSSKHESCPNVLFEAMLSKCLCIVSAGANTDIFVQDGVNGFVYDGTTAMLRGKIQRAINLVKKREHHEMVENGFRYAYENFSIDQMTDSYKSLYAEIITSRNRQALTKGRNDLPEIAL